jgi:hypothetical protein
MEFPKTEANCEMKSWHPIQLFQSEIHKYKFYGPVNFQLYPVCAERPRQLDHRSSHR